MQTRILIAVATYNERENLAPLVQEIRATVPAADVLILDDNSPDGTGSVADSVYPMLTLNNSALPDSVSAPSPPSRYSSRIASPPADGVPPIVRAGVAAV